MERFFRYIEEMRTRPLDERRRFALLCAGGVTFAVTLLWLFVLLPRSIDQSRTDAPETNLSEEIRSETEKRQSETGSLFEDMRQRYTDTKAAITKDVASLASTTASTSAEATIETGGVDVPPPPPAPAPGWQ